jgi:hypothetical protein
MSTGDNMSTFSYSFICDLVEFYGAEFMLLAAVVTHCRCGQGRAVFSTLFP